MPHKAVKKSDTTLGRISGLTRVVIIHYYLLLVGPLRTRCWLMHSHWDLGHLDGLPDEEVEIRL